MSPASATPDITETIEIGNIINATGSWVWLMNGYVAEADLNNPVLLHAQDEAAIYRPQWNVRNYGHNKTIRVILNNPIDFPHPMHIHGHNGKLSFVPLLKVVSLTHSKKSQSSGRRAWSLGWGDHKPRKPQSERHHNGQGTGIYCN